MRHQKRSRRFSRTSAHRQAMFANLVTSLLRHERVTTTVPKAKEARRLAEGLITLGKRGTLHARRMAGRTLRDRAILGKLFGEIAPRFEKRAGGYTRIVRVGRRPGDAAPMAVLELIERGAAPAQ